MSFQGLISGAECAVPANPLSQVLKHTEGDRSLQQDRIAGPSSSSSLHHLPQMSQSNVSQQDLAHARNFFDVRAGFGSQPGLANGPPALQDLHGTDRPGPDMSHMWAMEQRQMPSHARQSNWATEFERSMPSAASPPLQERYTAEQQSRPSYMYSMPMTRQPFSGMYGTPSFQGMNASFVQGKGKGKEIDFESAFAQFNDLSVSEPSSSRIEEVDDTKGTTQRVEEKDPTDFKQVWEELQNSEMPPPQEEMSKWESQFQQMMAAQRDDGEEDYGSSMQRAWEGGLGNFNETSSSHQFDESGFPTLGEYDFEKDNKYLDPSSSSEASSLAAAKALLEQNGSLSEAALLLEAAIQKGDLGEGGYEAWILLGETRNMDEREEAGLKALIEGVKRGEAAGADGVGMLSLAISYTNESFDRASHSTLVRWLQARFPSHPVPEDTLEALKKNNTWDTHQRVTDVFISLARSQHSQGVLDSDVQIGLGVLFYTNAEYERAKDCFQTALSARPRDYLLWNRYGSCLSNGNKAEEALGAYREALQIRPTYTRAIYNVGVACLNIGAYKEAAEHLLSAIAMQESTGSETSDQLWFTLRRTLLSMERSDLADLTGQGQNRGKLDVFRKEGFDF